MEVNVHQAKTHLSKLLRRTMEGEEIVIARAGVPIARLVSVALNQPQRPLDLDRGLYEVPADFDAPLPARVIALFEGSAGTNEKRHKGKRSRKRR